ncbi:cyclic lactone autoinducer peptide [Lachnospiraceae bacterium 29-91]
MKNFIKNLHERSGKGILSMLASLALVITTINVNSACWYVMGQNVLPSNSERLRKFE